ncbi:hypothetical protein GCM10010404_39480 [Nonomuraea africana]|uniref:Uncharacterized protein n=1 Tax=Nonomuraea africana TaxID=46171 RepID=A0ABR9KV90_9ACTN|nr:hypothetical protein [Nonomuraea africana]
MVDEALLRTLTPTVQDALVEAVRGWQDDPSRDPKGVQVQ